MLLLAPSVPCTGLIWSTERGGKWLENKEIRHEHKEHNFGKVGGRNMEACCSWEFQHGRKAEL